MEEDCLPVLAGFVSTSWACGTDLDAVVVPWFLGFGGGPWVSNLDFGFPDEASGFPMRCLGFRYR